MKTKSQKETSRRFLETLSEEDFPLGDSRQDDSCDVIVASQHPRLIVQPNRCCNVTICLGHTAMKKHNCTCAMTLRKMVLQDRHLSLKSRNNRVQWLTFPCFLHVLAGWMKPLREEHA